VFHATLRGEQLAYSVDKEEQRHCFGPAFLEGGMKCVTGIASGRKMASDLSLQSSTPPQKVGDKIIYSRAFRTVVAELAAGEREIVKIGEMNSAQRDIQKTNDMVKYARRCAYRARKRKKDLERWAAVERCLLCPIYLDRMVDPVCTSDGNVYERKALMRCLAQSHLSPLTREPLRGELVSPVRAIKDLLDVVPPSKAKAKVRLA
jgi:hypothetical protein